MKNIKNLTSKILYQLRNDKYIDCENLTDDNIKVISEATILHDIGKIGLPDEILNKNEKNLTTEERALIKTQLMEGTKILNKFLDKNEIFEYAYDICYNHHERWNGEGYPNKLKRDEISLWSQIVGMLDVYEKLFNKKERNNISSKKEAIKVLREGKLGSFNPALIVALEKVELMNE